MKFYLKHMKNHKFYRKSSEIMKFYRKAGDEATEKMPKTEEECRAAMEQLKAGGIVQDMDESQQSRV